MLNMTPKYRRIALGSVLGLMTSGCITIAPSNTPGVSWKSFGKSKVDQASYQQAVDDAPGDPKDPAKLKLAYGKMMEQNGHPDEARKSYASVVEKHPKNVDALLGIARLDYASANYDSAEQAYRRVLKVDTSNASAQFGLGQCHSAQKRWKEASEVLTKAMLAAPDESQYRYALAVSLVHLGDVDSALPHFIRTVGDAEAHYNVGLILQEEGKLQDAERQFLLAVTKKPDLVAAQDWLAHVRHQQSGDRSPSAPPPIDIFNSKVLPAGHSNPVAPSQAQIPSQGGNFVMPLTSQQLEQARNQSLPGA